MENLLDLRSDQITQWMSEIGQPAYRTGQVLKWILQRSADSFEAMSDLPQGLRARLAETFVLWSSGIAAHRRGDDGSEKLLLELRDGQQTECVLLRDDRGHRTACISTQVGCAMGCVFCASGIGGVERNLTRGEILEQLLRLQRLLPEGERLSHIVVMGMGEPLANLDALLPALGVATDSQGLGISARRITISTVGLPRGIRRLAEHDVPYHLAISLHAPDDCLRSELVPANRGTGIAAILEAADAYFAKTGRRVTYEYVLLAGKNDRSDDAGRLAALLRDRTALVNVIPLNPVEGLPYRTPRPEDTARFVDLLRSRGINVQVRWRKGDKIDAACGQLRRRAVKLRPE